MNWSYDNQAQSLIPIKLLSILSQIMNLSRMHMHIKVLNPKDMISALPWEYEKGYLKM